MVRNIQRVSVAASIFVLAIITVCVSGAYDKINAECVGTGCKIVYLQDVKISACDCPGSKVEYYANGNLKKFTLAEDWKQEDSVVYDNTSDSINPAISPRDIEDRNENKRVLGKEKGVVYKGGTVIEYDEKGYIKRYTLAVDWKSFDGKFIKKRAIERCSDYFGDKECPPNYVKAMEVASKRLEYENSGNKYFQIRRYGEAIENYNKAIELEPKLAEELKPKLADAYGYLGNDNNQYGYYDKAIFCYTKAIQLNPKLVADYYNNRGNAYKNKGDYNKAIADYNQAIQINPRDYLAYSYRGDSYKNKGDYDKAIADYNQAIQINPRNYLTYKDRGGVYLKKGDKDKANADFNTANQIEKREKEIFENEVKISESLKASCINSCDYYRQPSQGGHHPYNSRDLYYECVNGCRDIPYQ